MKNSFGRALDPRLTWVRPLVAEFALARAAVCCSILNSRGIAFGCHGGWDRNLTMAEHCRPLLVLDGHVVSFTHRVLHPR